jgi:hypothetical protein
MRKLYNISYWDNEDLCSIVSDILNFKINKMDTVKSITVLNSFIIINNARIKRYKNASKIQKNRI